MSDIWTFSPENKALLQRCLSSAAAPDGDNKWLKIFGPRNLELLNKANDTITVDDSPETDEDQTVQERQDGDVSATLDEFLDPDINIISKLDYLQEKCRKNPKLLEKLAETLPTNTAEKLLHHVLATESLNSNFLEVFYECFVYNYIRRENSRFCIDFLLQTYDKHPQYLKKALKPILKDVEIQNNIVNDFILNLNSEKCTDFLIFLSDIEFTPNEFTHNIFNIHTAYKSCNKSDNIQNYIFSCLKSYSDFCSSDKNFGKLMLAFLQHENSLKRDISSTLLEGIIERHKSPFKRPCLTVLREIKENK